MTCHEENQQAAALLPCRTKLCGQQEQSAAKNKITGTSAAKPLTFRGEPIEWVTVPKTKTAKTANAIGEDETEECCDGMRHLIAYQGKLQSREEFLKSVFPDYKKYPYKVRFQNDDIYRLSGN